MVLATPAPFHLEATVRVLQRRPSNPVDRWEHGRYLRLLRLPQGLALVEVENRGTIADPAVHCRVRAGNRSAAARVEAGLAMRRMLGLDVDPVPMQQAVEAEPALRDIAVMLRGLRPPRFAGLFEAFARVVPFQQLSLEAGVAIVGRLVTKFGEHLECEGRRIYAFPASHAIAGAGLARLRACGLSARKAQALRDLARAVDSGLVTEPRLAAMSTPEALAALIDLPGIGPWSAALVMLRGFGRLDVFPPGDVGAMRRLRTLLQLGPQAPLDDVIERFGKHRGYLYFCALGGSLLSQGLIEPVPGAKAVAPTPAGTGLRPSATARQQPGRAPDRR